MRKGSRLVVAHYLLHTTAYDVAWLACILLASTSWAQLGPSLVLVFVVILYGWQHFIMRKTYRLLAFIGLFWLMGTAADSFLCWLGAIELPSTAYAHLPWGPPIAPLFMQALWIIFAITIYATLPFLFNQLLLSGLLSCISVPFAYWLGALLDAAIIPAPARHLPMIGVVYGVLIPLVFILYKRIKEPS